MNNEFLAALDANTSQSIARRVKRRLPDIEAALARGFTHREIRAQLEREGIVLTESYYARLIPRLRNQKRTLNARPVSPPVAGGGGGEREAPQHELSAKPSRASPASPVPVSKTDELSAGLAEHASARPRTISPTPPERKKFVWDPHGANKIDPNNF